jgi:CubicO group peptidase (beta-lactamase class C family)
MPRFLYLFVFSLLFALPARAQAPFDAELLAKATARAAALPRLHALIVARDGVPAVEKVVRGPDLDRPVNIKSASKTIIDALVGIAIDKGVLKGVNEPILPLLKRRAPAKLDPQVGAITLDHLMSMRAGLERTSGLANYGRWVKSPNWVSFALTRPFLAAPGETFLYSTGNTHLLSAILTDASRKSTLELAREWLGKPLGIAIPGWTRDPQGIYFGGNEMALSPRALFKFAELYRRGGVTADGTRVLSERFVRAAWTPQGSDRRGNGYGYGWFITAAYGHAVYFGWGFGGQMLYVIPDLALTVIVTSDSTTRSVDDGYICQLHDLVANGFMPAAMGKDVAPFAPVDVCDIPRDALSP